MALTPVEFPRFGGLNLALDAQDVGWSGAVDLLDVDFDDLGRVRTRSGTTVLGTGTGTVLQYLARHSTDKLIADGIGGTAKIYAYDLAGSELTSLAHVGSALRGAVSIGTPTATYTYATMGSGGNAIRYDGATFSSIAAIAGWTACGVTPWDNRLVVGQTSANPSRVAFSDAGAPETFGANNYVDLLPGDGESILAIAAWRDLLFVFKASKFFVFYGTDVDGSGLPVFKYNTVNTGIGLRTPLNAAFQSVVAGDDALYFVGVDGVYATTGGAPVPIAQSLAPVFRARTSSYFTGVAGQITSASNWEVVLGYHLRRLYVSCWDNVNLLGNTFVIDLGSGLMSMYSIAAGTFATINNNTGYPPRLYYTRRNSTDAKIRYFNPSATTDDGTAISAKYRFGFWNPGKPGTEADIFEWLIEGSGTVTMKTAVNDAVTLGTGQAVTLGTAPALAQGRDMRAVWGRNVSLELSGTAPWTVSRVVANVSGQTQPGYKAA